MEHEAFLQDFLRKKHILTWSRHICLGFWTTICVHPWKAIGSELSGNLKEMLPLLLKVDK